MGIIWFKIGAIASVIVMLQGVGCRGWTSSEPPVHLNPNMDIQPRYKALRESSWFADKRDMRPELEGVVSRGHLKTDDYFHSGMENNAMGNRFPDGIKVDGEFIRRGQERFNIYCASCHDQTGSGGGLVGKRMMVKPVSLHQERLYDVPHGYLFNVITNGMATMPALKSIVSEKDRWAIVAYVRALQISQNADREWPWNR